MHCDQCNDGGGGTEDFPAVAAFAQNIFGEPFSEQGIVTAERKDLIHDDCWGGKADSLCYPAWQEILSSDKETVLQDLVETGKQYGIPDTVLQNAVSRSNGRTGEFLYHVLSGDAYVMDVKSLFSSSPTTLNEAADLIFLMRRRIGKCWLLS